MKNQDKSKDTILVFGNGQMAGFLADYLDNLIIAKADITKPDQIKKDLKKFRPDIVINTAAQTSIDWCELNKEQAFEVNTLGAFTIWQECQKKSIFFCHFSSGCVFSSKTDDQIYTEDDKPNPDCYYSWTKVWAENLLGKSPQMLILRPRMVVSSKVDRRNTLAKWLVYSHFISDQNTLTVIEDMLPVIKDLLSRRISGTFNIANEGTISPYEAALILKKYVNPKLKINKTTLDEMNENLVAKRVTTILSMQKLNTIGYKLPPANESFIKTTKKFAENLNKKGTNKLLNKVRKDTKQKYSIKQKTSPTYTSIN